MEIRNFYELLPKQYQENIKHYPNEEKLNIQLNSRILIIGPSGSKKTSLLMNLISAMNCFNNFIICAKNTQEPLYRWLIDTLKHVEEIKNQSLLHVCSSIAELPILDELNKNKTTICVLDDQIGDKQQILELANDWFIRSRKNSVTLVVISQNWFSMPTLWRNNCTYIFFKKLSNDSEAKRILRSLGVDDIVFNLYKQATLKSDDFFLVDRITDKEDLRYRHNFGCINDMD